jgi:hypothetical protein
MTIRQVAYELETSGADGLPEHIDRVRITIQSRVAYDLARDKFGWPKGEEAMFLWVAYVSWRELIKHYGFPEFEPGGKVQTFKRFREEVLIDFEAIDEKKDGKGSEGDGETDPTSAAAESGPPSPSPPQPDST